MASGCLDAVTQHSEPLLATMGGATRVDIVASGASLSAVHKSALVLHELARMNAADIDSADDAGTPHAFGAGGDL
jgi:hypothetical protein